VPLFHNDLPRLTCRGGLLLLTVIVHVPDYRGPGPAVPARRAGPSSVLNLPRLSTLGEADRKRVSGSPSSASGVG
jgi:hypothetical protein